MKGNDRCDINPHELTLIRAGHHLWRESRKKGLTVNERQAIDVETIWQAKRELRLKLAAERKNGGASLWSA